MNKNNKTINFAITKLPIDCRIKFLNLWNSLGCMDLYNGELSAYIDVINQDYLQKVATIDRLEKKIIEIRKVANHVSFS